MSLFLYNYSDSNYPFISSGDIPKVKSLFEGLSLLSASPVYLAGASATPSEFSGVFEHSDGSSYGHFYGTFSEPARVVSSTGTVLGFVYPGPPPTDLIRWSGRVQVSPLCVNPTGDASEGVRRLSFGGYLQSMCSGGVATVTVLPEFSGDQKLDARDWDLEGSILSINGVSSPIGSLVLSIDAGLGSFSMGTKTILLNTPETPNFVCGDAYKTRDMQIKHSKVAGSPEPLPLDLVIDADWNIT